MPKFATHILFADEALRSRPSLFDPLHTNALRFGAVGPDVTLFMFDPATSNPDVRKGLELFLRIQKDVQDIKDFVDGVKEQFAKPVDDLKDWLTGGLSKDLEYLITASMETLLLATKLGLALGSGSININNPVFKFISNPNFPAGLSNNPLFSSPRIPIDGLDNFGFPFRMFGHPYTDDGSWRQPYPVGDYSHWWWVDMLHYRKTGQFAQELLKQANGPVQLSYAKGYMTHVAGDICGHPFINALVGGPYRNHTYRHYVLESLVDTWLWNNQGRADILGAQLDQLIQLGNADADQVSTLVISAMKTIYQDPMLPSLLRGRYPQPDEFLQGYRLLQAYLRAATASSVARPAPPPSNPKDILEEIKTLLQNNLPGSPPNFDPRRPADFLLALFSWAEKGFVLLIMLATLPQAVITRFLMAEPRWVIYLFELGIYYILSAVRVMLCLVGWGYASKEDFENFGFLEDLVTSEVRESYPYKTLNNPKPPFYWMIPPQAAARREDNSTIPLLARARLMPSWMLDRSNQMDAANIQLLNALCNANTPAQTIALEHQLLSLDSRGFGNAVDFGIGLLSGSFAIPDLDLDGDRGFAYRGWEVLPPNERYV